VISLLCPDNPEVQWDVVIAFIGNNFFLVSDYLLNGLNLLSHGEFQSLLRSA
jgi:hypothetical protein